MKVFKNIIILIITISIIVLFLFNVNTAINGAINGLMICGKQVIPSLFPITVFVLFLYQSQTLELLLPPKCDKNSIIIFMVSLIGGYPIGAKLISTAHNSGKISTEKAENLLPFCINPGPAFTIGVIGNCLFGSRKLGVILFVASIIIAFISFLCFYRRHLLNVSPSNNNNLNVSENFVLSVASACDSMIIISGYVVLFSAIVNIIKDKINNQLLKTILIGLLEVTTAVKEFDNIYIIAFLIGFSGISIILQVITLSRNYFKKIRKLLFSRILYGFSMSLTTYFLLKICPVNIATLSNSNINTLPEISKNGITFTVLFYITSFIMIYTINNKKFSGKIRKDIL